MPDQQIITLRLAEDFFGLDIVLVREINRNLDIIPVDLAPPYVKGLLNLRGQIVTVIDLGVRLGLGPRKISDTSSCIVLKTRSELERNALGQIYAHKAPVDLVGIFIDQIGDVVTVNSEEIEPPTTHSSGIAAKFLDGVIKLEKQLLVTLKIDQIIGLEEAVAA